LPASTGGGTTWYNSLTGDAIPSGTEIFTVSALKLPPEDLNTPWAYEDDEVVIGKIVTTSTFTTSLWGDERLFFEHVKFWWDLNA